jgi:hypothetical protein
MNSSAIEFESERLVPGRATKLTFTILLLVFFLVLLLIDLGFYVKEPVNGGALVATLTETSVSWVEPTCRTAAYLLPLATTVRAFIIVIVIPFIVIPIFVLVIFLFLVPLFFLPSTLLVVFAASVMGRSFLRVCLVSTLA